MLRLILANLILVVAQTKKKSPDRQLVQTFVSNKQTKEILAETDAPIIANVPNDMKVLFSWYTEKERFDDNTDDDYLVGTVTVANMQTSRFEGNENTAKDEIRVTLGIRNPQEDAFDITSLSVLYDRDESRVRYRCYDGYSNGTLITDKYRVNGQQKRDPKSGQVVDELGRRNITIKQWTDKPLE